MAFIQKRLYGPQSIPNFTLTTVYTCPSAQTTTTLIKQVILTNTASSEAKGIYLSLLAQGAPNDNSKYILNNAQVPANETVIIDLSLVMNSGDKIELYVQGSSPNLLNATLSGVESAGGMVVSGLADDAVTTDKIADSNVTAAKLGPNVLLGNNQSGAIITMEMM